MNQLDAFRKPVTDPVARAHRIIDVAVRRHKPVAVFGMFSGGHDSVCATHVASQHPAFTAAVHINTGIGIEETREYVRDTCRDQGWSLLEYHAKDEGQDYEAMVLHHGFPGPHSHTYMYNRLKERAIRTLIRQHKSHVGQRVMLVTGVRRSESTRRMATTQTVLREGARVWVGPLVDWTDETKHAYVDAHDLPRNEVVANLCMSGECLCGAFAKPGELEEIAFWYPGVAAHIRALEKRAKLAGVPCKWGERPPEEDEADPLQAELPLPLCVGCQAKWEAA